MAVMHAPAHKSGRALLLVAFVARVLISALLLPPLFGDKGGRPRGNEKVRENDGNVLFL